MRILKGKCVYFILFVLFVLISSSCNKDEMNILIEKKDSSIKQDSRSKATLLKIGDSYQGGKIFYILKPGDLDYIEGVVQGLIVAPSDKRKDLRWYNGKFILTGATLTSIGTGNINTNNIIFKQGYGEYAANYCADLVVYEGTKPYSDWYLPSKDELNMLYLNRNVVDKVGFHTGKWWSSTEYNLQEAYYQYFFTGGQGHFAKQQTISLKVCPIRKFTDLIVGIP